LPVLDPMPKGIFCIPDIRFNPGAMIVKLLLVVAL
jgi:hypothetical protein